MNSRFLKLIFLLFFNVCLVSSLWAQKTSIDSLVNTLAKSATQDKVETLIQLAWEQRDNYPRKSINYTDEALELANSLGYVEAIPKILNFQGVALRNLGEYSKAMDSYHQSLLQAEELGNKEQKGYALVNIGNLHYYQGNYVNALERLYEALQVAEEIDDKGMMSYCTLNLGYIYLQENNFNKALSYQQKTLQLRTSLSNHEGEVSALTSIGDVYQKWGELDRALEYYNDALIKAKEINYLIMQYDLQQAIGQIYAKRHQKKHLLLSLNKFKIALQGFEAMDSKPRLPSIYRDIAEVQRQLGLLDSALLNSQIGLRLARELGQKEQLKDIAELQSSLYVAKGDYQKALRALRTHVRISKTITSEEEIRKRNRLQTQIALAEKDKQINYLQVQNEVSKANLKAQRAVVAAMAVFLLSGIVLLIYTNRGKKRIEVFNSRLLSKTRQINKQKEEIAIKANEIEKANKALKNKNGELSQAVEQLNLAQEHLTEADKMASLGHLSAGIAHEINNPINFVTNSIQPLREDINELIELIKKYREAADSKQIKLLEIINEETNSEDTIYTLSEIEELLKGMEDGALRAQEIVTGMKNFARRDDEIMQACNIKDGLNSTLTLLKRNYKNVVVSEFYDANVPLVDCSIGKINQVFMNVIDNAFQAVENLENPQVTISTEFFPINEHTEYEQDYVIIKVNDNGKGMSEEVKQRIFEPFFTTKRIGKGTGLGLSISLGIIEKHQGTIEVESEPNEGTTFTIILPVRQNESAPQEL